MKEEEKQTMVSAIKEAFDPKFDELKTSMNQINGRLDGMETKINTKISTLQTKIGLKQIEAEVQSRKRNVVITGLPGPAGEKPDVTKVMFDKLLAEAFEKVEPMAVIAVHRLNSKLANSGVVVALTRQEDVDYLLDNARKLGRYNNTKQLKVSLHVQTVPVLRQYRNELLFKRSKFRPDLKKKSHVKSLMKFPFFSLRIKEYDVKTGKSRVVDEIFPDITEEKIVMEFFGEADDTV